MLDRDQSHESRAYLEELRGSAYFVEKPPITDYAELEQRLSGGSIDCAIEIPPGFGRDIERGGPAWVAAWVDGARPFIAQTIRGYLQAMHELYLTDRAVATTAAAARCQSRYRGPVQIQSGFRQHLRDGAVDPVAAAGAVSRRS